MNRAAAELGVAFARLSGAALIAWSLWHSSIASTTALLYLIILALASPALACLLALCMLACPFFWMQQDFALGHLLVVSIAVLVFRLKGEAIVRNGAYAEALLQRSGAVRLALWFGALVACTRFAMREVALWIPVMEIGCMAAFLTAWPKAPKGHVRRTLMNAVLLMCSVLVSLVLCEAVARRSPTGAPMESTELFSFHPEAGFTLTPNAKGQVYRRKSADKMKEIPAAISSEGLRDREFGPRKPNEFRIFLLGDSFAMGWALELEQSLPKALERAMAEAGRAAGVDVVVMNGGVSNYGPWQERVFLRERGFPLSPCVVLHELFPGNDVENTLARSGKFPEAYNVEAERYAAKWYSMNTWPVRVEEALKRRSALYRLLIRSGMQPNPICQWAWKTRLGARPKRWELPASAPRSFNLEACLRNWYPLLAEGWREMESDVRDTRDDCTARGIDYVAFCIPELCDVNEGGWREATRVLGQDAYERFKDVRVVEEFCQQEDISYVRVCDAITALEREKPAYFVSDGHLNPDGVTATANALAEFLIRRYFPEGKGPVYPKACNP